MKNYQDLLSKNLNTNARVAAENIEMHIKVLSRFENGIPPFQIEEFLTSLYKYFVLINIEHVYFKNRFDNIRLHPDKEMVGRYKIGIHFEPEDLFSKLYVTLTHIYIALNNTKYYEDAIEKAKDLNVSTQDDLEKAKQWLDDYLMESIYLGGYIFSEIQDNKEVHKYDKKTGFLYIHRDETYEIKMSLDSLGPVFAFEERFIALNNLVYEGEKNSKNDMDT